MMKCHRPAAPEVLKDARQWGIEYEATKTSNSSYKFKWKIIDGVPVNQHLLPLLRVMAAEHCCYCDGFPVAALSRETIDHFRPKGTFPHLVYEWENLFYCCDRCQAIKLENFSTLLLKLDETEYEFARYFIINFDSGVLTPNPLASLEDQERAKCTIDLLNLNNRVLCVSRQREIRDYNPNYPVDTYSYRYLFY